MNVRLRGVMHFKLTCVFCLFLDSTESLVSVDSIVQTHTICSWNNDDTEFKHISESIEKALEMPKKSQTEIFIFKILWKFDSTFRSIIQQRYLHTDSAYVEFPPFYLWLMMFHHVWLT